MRPEIYENQAAVEQIEGESAPTGPRVTKMELGNGIRMWIEGHDHPYKGAATAEAVFAINTVKRLLKDMPLAAFLMPRKTLKFFTGVAWTIVSPYILKENYMMPCARELRAFLGHFLDHAGLNVEVPTRTLETKPLAAILSHIIELDAAYRYRFQDLCNESTRYALRNRPIRELWRLVEINRKRDYPSLHKKVRRLARMLTILLLWPPFHKAFTYAISRIDFGALQFDEGDRYWIDLRTDYGKNNVNKPAA